MNEKLYFPLTSNIDETSGVTDFTNDMDNGITYIDKVGLEGLITFHEAEFGTFDGNYFNSGRNIKMNVVIKNLYDLILKLTIQ